MKELEPCPFCGKCIEILTCDSEGNLRDDEYVKDPWSGLGYMITHPVDEDICPVATNEEESLGCLIFDSIEELTQKWNRREYTPSPERIAELLEADRDDRVVVLPCKVGDIIFDLHNGKVRELRIRSIDFYCAGIEFNCSIIRHGTHNIGKTVFLTPEEAEDALAERKDEKI